MNQDKFIELWIKMMSPVTTRYQSQRAFDEIMHSRLSISGTIYDVFLNEVKNIPVVSLIVRFDIQEHTEMKVFIQADFPYWHTIKDANKYDSIDLIGDVYYLQLPDWEPEKINVYMKCFDG